MLTARSRPPSQGFTLIEISLLSSVILIILTASFLLKDRLAGVLQPWLPVNFLRMVTPTPIPQPTVFTPTVSDQVGGQYQYLPQTCLQDLKSEDCKLEFKALLDERCGGRLRNDGCEPIRQEVFTYASERVCQVQPDSGICKCLQSKDFQSQACQGAIQELINKMVEGVCQPDPQAQVCQCLQSRDFQSQGCKDAYFNFLMDIVKKRCQEDVNLPACQCVDAANPKLCLLLIKR